MSFHAAFPRSGTDITRKSNRPIAGRGAKSLTGARRFHRSLIDSSRTSETFAKKNAGPIKNAEAPKDAGALGLKDAALSLTGEASASTSPTMVSLSGEDLVLGMEKNGVFKERKMSVVLHTHHEVIRPTH